MISSFNANILALVTIISSFGSVLSVIPVIPEGQRYNIKEMPIAKAFTRTLLGPLVKPILPHLIQNAVGENRVAEPFVSNAFDNMPRSTSSRVTREVMQKYSDTDIKFPMRSDRIVMKLTPEGQRKFNVYDGDTKYVYETYKQSNGKNSLLETKKKVTVDASKFTNLDAIKDSIKGMLPEAAPDAIGQGDVKNLEVIPKYQTVYYPDGTGGYKKAYNAIKAKVNVELRESAVKRSWGSVGPDSLVQKLVNKKVSLDVKAKARFFEDNKGIVIQPSRVKSEDLGLNFKPLDPVTGSRQAFALDLFKLKDIDFEDRVLKQSHVSTLDPKRAIEVNYIPGFPEASPAERKDFLGETNDVRYASKPDAYIINRHYRKTNLVDKVDGALPEEYYKQLSQDRRRRIAKGFGKVALGAAAGAGIVVASNMLMNGQSSNDNNQQQ